MEPPSVTEVRTCLLALKTKKAAGPDRVDPILLKEGGEALIVALSKLFEDIWLTEKVPSDWGASISSTYIQERVISPYAATIGVLA